MTTIRKIKTRLVGKEETFKVLALGELTQLPVLLLGEPGVGKTQCLIDYAAAKYNYNSDLVKDKTFIIELDEGTKTSEIKGRVNMKALMEDKEYKIDAPIADAEFLLINEVDKGTSGVRNTLLSVMREKALFYGDEIKKCDWTVFAGSCNVIPEDELENPFWDRFVLTQKVERVGAGQFKDIWKNKVIDLDIPMPTKEDINKEQISDKNIVKFIKVVYEAVSDRTASYLHNLVKAIKLIYEVDEIEALMKCCELIAPSHVADLSSKLETKKENNLRTKIQGLEGVIAGNNQNYTEVYVSNILEDLDELGKMRSYKRKVEELTADLNNHFNEKASDDLIIYYRDKFKSKPNLLQFWQDGALDTLKEVTFATANDNDYSDDIV
ncbi:MAG: hypothetical protein GOVbin1709_73 [Prokaryotic dsDNA virus sp.]|nr:MAG: hypothetical protein GOVbin1709_73 [Prokaryotic dsDNA virus sp.]|tara:strand:+ start:18488 stop:19630 length:1143 start_codon:yes stop_codon:yes gene_type:complete